MNPAAHRQLASLSETCEPFTLRTISVKLLAIRLDWTGLG